MRSIRPFLNWYEKLPVKRRELVNVLIPVALSVIAIAFGLLNLAVTGIKSFLVPTIDASRPRLDALWEIEPPDVGVNKNRESVLVLRANVTNSGAPSIVRGFEVYVERQATGFRRERLVLTYPDVGDPPLRMARAGTGERRELRAEDMLPQKTRVAVQSGGSVNGYLVAVTGEIPIHAFGAFRVVLKFRDVLGNEYEDVSPEYLVAKPPLMP
jgi:hypothetical protein